ncbi:GntR family transcriptional regulator [Streptomyces sp. NBC_00145]|uniref:GntR family transcriptional regulator n=1 Tax=Streptomyces sp. NBC_00145 TaxID=2975666 RepID=UPI002E195063
MNRRRPGTTVDNVYQTLRGRIVEGEYQPGMRMSQGGLASELNISRTPLREALNRLEADGLVVSEANRGMEVAPVSDSQVEECYALRLLVEPATLAAISADLTDAELDEMDAALADMETKKNRIRDFQAAHLSFHELTLRRYPESVRELTRSLHLKIYRHQRLHFSRPHVPEHFTNVDRILLQSLRAREPERARHVLEFHLADAAIGMILDKDPDYRFDSLLVAVRGLGIEVEQAMDGHLPRPTTISWPGGEAKDIVELTTANLDSASHGANA